MPELPEVEIARRNFARWLKGHRVVKAEAERSRIFRGAQPKAFERIQGKLVRAERKGKYLLFSFEDGTGVLAHLGMTGKLVRRKAGVAEPYSRARFVLDTGQVIHFRDPRMFGRIEPAPVDRLWSLPAIAQLGRDPLDDGLTAQELREAMGRTRLPIKVALMDQSRIAGLGNIHAAEALYRAGIHPARTPSQLKPHEWDALARGIHDALAFALNEQRDEEIEYVEEPGSENPFLIYGRAGTPCQRCKTRVQSMPQGGRTTHFCPKCQPKRGTRR